MRIGIVTTWFERGAAYVSKQYVQALESEGNEVFIYARSGESYAKGSPEWDNSRVYWSKPINSPFAVTVVNKKEFVKWAKDNSIEAIIFNEQHWWEPLIWCYELGIKTIAYIDYYTESTVPLFEIYDVLICHTKRHFEAFSWHKGARYIPWGTDTELFKPKPKLRSSNKIILFHSCGMNPKRKGTDLLLKSLPFIVSDNYKVVIHTQKDLKIFFPNLSDLINNYEEKGRLEIINKTVKAPGLYFLGDIYVYPSRLEGVGLTVAEAVSSGLIPIVPDCPPMNEFIENELGSAVKIGKLFSRSDGYYWPQNEVNIEELANTINTYLGMSVDAISRMKLANRKFAEQKLCWSKNIKGLNEIVKKPVERVNKEPIISEIKKFERQGFRKLNKIYLVMPGVFDKMKNIL